MNKYIVIVILRIYFGIQNFILKVYKISFKFVLKENFKHFSNCSIDTFSIFYFINFIDNNVNNNPGNNNANF